MNKIFVLMVCMFLLIAPLISAFEFDNVKNYDEETKTIDIRNSVLGIPFLQLGKVAEVQLISPTVNYVIMGEDRLVAEFEIRNFKDYTEGAFDNLEFHNIKRNMKKFDREFNYRYKEFYDIEVTEYKRVCKEKMVWIEINNSYEQEVYDSYQNRTGSHLEERFDWISFNSKKDLQKGNITIGIFTDVLPNEKIEWIPTLFGVEINEWAEWTESFNVDLISYYKMDDNLANTDVDDELNANEGLFAGGENTEDASVAGRVGTALDFDGNDYINTTMTTFGSGLSAGTSASFWIKTTDTSYIEFGVHSTADQIFGLEMNWGSALDSGKLKIILYDIGVSKNLNAYTTADTDFNNGSWHHIVYTINASNNTVQIYVDGDSKAMTYVAQETPVDFANFDIPLYIGAHNFKTTGAKNWLEGVLDEFGIWSRILSQEEVTGLSSGITYRDVFPVLTTTQSYPVDAYSLPAGIVGIGCNFSSIDQNITDVTVLVYDSGDNLDYTNTESGLTTTSYNKSWNTTPLTSDVYSWACLGEGSGGVDNITGNRTFTIVVPILTATQSYPADRLNISDDTPDLSCNFTANLQNISDVTINIYDSGDNLDYTNTESGLTTMNYNKSWTATTLTDDVYLWSCTGLGSNDANDTTTNRTLTIDTIAPVINIEYPLNTTYNTNQSVLNFTYIDNNLGVCWGSNDSGLTNTSTVIPPTNITNIFSNQGTNNWTLYCNDSLGNNAIDNIIFFMDSLYPLIDYGVGTKVDNYNSTVDWIYVNLTVTEINLANITFLLWNSTTEIDRTTYDSTRFINWTSLADNVYTYNATACDSLNLCNTTATRTLTIDTIAPIITFISPNLSNNYGKIGQNISLNWSIAEDHLQYCSFYYNGANRTIDCAEGNYTFALKENFYDLTFFANDSFGHTTQELFSWNYTFLLINQSWVASTLSAIINPFRIIFETFGTPITVAYLNYNGTNNLGSISSSGNVYTLFRNVTSLNVLSSTQNASFFWNITSQNGFNYLTDPENQTINPINFTDNCANYFYIYNITLVDEVTQAKINATGENSSIKVDLRLFNLERTVNLLNYSNDFSKINPATICSSQDLSSGERYSLDMQIQYGTASHSTEIYNIENALLSAGNLYKNLTLYDLETSKTNKFRLRVRDSSYLPLGGGLIQIERKYLENGTFLISEIPKTDARGITSASLQVNDAIYNFHIYKNGELVNSFTEVIAICQTPLVSECEIDFNNFQTEIVIPNYEEGNDFDFTLVYNSTSDIISSQFLIPSGIPSEVQLVVIRDDVLGTAVCSDTITASSGSLSCIIPTSFGNATVLAKLYKDGNEEGKGNIRLNQSPSDIFGVVLVILSVIVLITLIGIGISDSPIITMIFLFVGVILISSISLVANNGFIGATAVILFLAIAIIIFIIKAAKRS